MLEALVATKLGRPHAANLAEAGLSIAKRQGAWRWEPRLRLLLAAATTDRDEFARLLADSDNVGPLALLEVADVVVDNLDLSAGPVGTVESPSNSFLIDGSHHCGGVSQPVRRLGRTLLHDSWRSSAGEPTLLRCQPGSKRTRDKVDSESCLVLLSRRVTPKLHLHDLGRTEFDIESTTGPAVAGPTKGRRPPAVSGIKTWPVGRSRTRA